MALSLSAHGDILERTYATFVQQNIPAYEEIWKRYIGNDGTAHIIKVDSMQNDLLRDRIIFSQYHYSVLESLVCLQLIVDDINLLSINSIEEYLKFNTTFLAFQSHMGRIRDCILKLGEIFKIHDLYIPLDEYYKQRNNILHGCKIPFMIRENFIEIPEIKGMEENAIKWHDKLTWADAKSIKHKPVLDYMNETYRGLLATVNSCLYRLLQKVNELVKKNNIDYNNFDRLVNITDNPGASGYMDPMDNHIFNFSNFNMSACYSRFNVV